eukprot:GGOE01041532.1.p1 GENE.GGOE01041532.1~~GGOE01041532.1.p1  ORF type:complete len:279 (+),score=45.17 GGOE01041532.1:57-839(+)
MSETATYPIDFVKTRVQSNITKLGPLKMAIRIVSEEGFSVLYRGLSAAILRHWVYSATRIALYEQFRNETDKRKWGFAGKLFSGAFAGAIGQFIASPTDLVKVRLQTDRGRQLYRGVGHCLRVIYAEGGPRAFFYGWLPNVQRAMAVNVGELAAYDQCKRLVLKYTSLPDNAQCHGLASIGSGFFSTLCSTPMDVMKTRLMQSQSQFRGVAHCFTHTVRTEGFLALYKGFVPTWARLGPWQFIFWVTYEESRRYAGLGGF